MSQVYGNKEIVELLELYLKTAREHPFGGVSIVMVGNPNVVASDFAGEIGLQTLLKDASVLQLHRIQKEISNWTLPPQDESLGKDYVRYNLANGPLGFDFLIWLVDAEMTRRAAGAPAPLKVAFYKGLDAEKRMQHDNREMWENKVFRPCIDLIGAVYDERALYGHNKHLFVSRDIVKMAQEGQEVPKLKSKGNYDLPEGAVTITLRESEQWPHRNSNLNEWKKFARELKDRVIFVRDTSQAYGPIDGFETCPLASTNLDARMALYERSKVNLFVSNGPAALALFSDKPWLQFVQTEPDSSHYTPNTRKFWKESAGIEVGSQYPWSSPNQRMVWEKDTYENIKSAYEALDLKG